MYVIGMDENESFHLKNQERGTRNNPTSAVGAGRSGSSGRVFFLFLSPWEIVVEDEMEEESILTPVRVATCILLIAAAAWTLATSRIEPSLPLHITALPLT